MVPASASRKEETYITPLTGFNAFKYKWSARALAIAVFTQIRFTFVCMHTVVRTWVYIDVHDLAVRR